VLNWYKLSAGKKHECILDNYLTGIFSLKIEELKVDLKSGVMNINADCNEVAENIALAFSASLLHVLCIPRKRNWKEGYKLGPVVQNNMLRQVPSDNMALVVAAGLHCSTPYNLYLQTHHDEHTCVLCALGCCDGLTIQ